jgi:hypothetical protein
MDKPSGDKYEREKELECRIQASRTMNNKAIGHNKRNKISSC